MCLPLPLIRVATDILVREDLVWTGVAHAAPFCFDRHSLAVSCQQHITRGTQNPRVSIPHFRKRGRGGAVGACQSLYFVLRHGAEPYRLFS
jgi:hypothetical protein